MTPKSQNDPEEVPESNRLPAPEQLSRQFERTGRPQLGLIPQISQSRLRNIHLPLGPARADCSTMAPNLFPGESRRFLSRRRLLGMPLAAAWGVAASRAARAQFVEAGGDLHSPQFGAAGTQRYRVGVRVAARGGRCRDIYATLPVPMDWPEQQARIVDQDTSTDIRRLRFRETPGAARQMIVEISDLPAAAEAHAILTFELTRRAILAPPETAGLVPPAKSDRQLRQFLSPSPYIESRHPAIVKLARQTVAGLLGWKKVEAIYDVVRERVEYRNGELKGAAKALADGWGDCEELTCLFIAMARATGVPARTVWVEGHCYPEFYLVDAGGNGHWFPCQAAGSRAFGSMPDLLPILQKGDHFRDPDRPGQSLRYLSEFIRGSAVGGGGSPQVSWVREGA